MSSLPVSSSKSVSSSSGSTPITILSCQKFCVNLQLSTRCGSASPTSITWTSSNSLIASVTGAPAPSTSAVVIAVSGGTITITANAIVGGSTVIQTFQVVVLPISSSFGAPINTTSPFYGNLTYNSTNITTPFFSSLAVPTPISVNTPFFGSLSVSSIAPINLTESIAQDGTCMGTITAGTPQDITTPIYCNGNSG
jgi:hypothetical protein